MIPEVPAGEESDAFAVADWIESCEAEQHRLCVGRSTEPVCWTLCGFASGYMTAVHQRPVYAVEERCAAYGDPHCRLVARFDSLRTGGGRAQGDRRSVRALPARRDALDGDG